MTPTQFAKVGEALYGPSWQGRMAVALNVSDRTVRRWVTEATPIPDGIADDLKKLCRVHAEKLTKIADQLEGKY